MRIVKKAKLKQLFSEYALTTSTSHDLLSPHELHYEFTRFEERLGKNLRVTSESLTTKKYKKGFPYAKVSCILRRVC